MAESWWRLATAARESLPRSAAPCSNHFINSRLDRHVVPSGTGLGLSIVRDFAGFLAGTIAVSEAPEGGALFVLDLPSVAPPGTTVRPGGGERTDARNISQ